MTFPQICIFVDCNNDNDIVFNKFHFETLANLHSVCAIFIVYNIVIVVLTMCQLTLSSIYDKILIEIQKHHCIMKSNRT